MKREIVRAAPIVLLGIIVADAAIAATTGTAPVTPSVMGLKPVPAPQIVQQAAPAVKQVCSTWDVLWPAFKENMLSAASLAGIASVLAMLLPQGQPGTPYGLVRNLIDLFALNMRNAANAPKLPVEPKA
jgi:hypothetical protein